jgi:predicted DNA-binding transcriptional regulator AlpA
MGTRNAREKRTFMAHMLAIPAFVAEHGISRSLFYRLVKEGRGPRLTKIASRTLISAEAAAEWRAMMERETEQAPPRSQAFEAHPRRVAA